MTLCLHLLTCLQSIIAMISICAFEYFFGLSHVILIKCVFSGSTSRAVSTVASIVNNSGLRTATEISIGQALNEIWVGQRPTGNLK